MRSPILTFPSKKVSYGQLLPRSASSNFPSKPPSGNELHKKVFFYIIASPVCRYSSVGRAAHRNAQVAGSSPAASSRVLPKFRRDFCFFVPDFSLLQGKRGQNRMSVPAPATLLPARLRPCRTPATLPPFLQRCATACPRAPGRRRARYRTRAAPCPPGRWSAADAPCSAPR